ncbi:MAG: ECF transporter S component [Clostridia bacterium]|nr:ECF transporter S component [Clostridia bacterium]
MKNNKVLKLVQLALLAAIVIVFQMMGSFIHIGPTSVSLVLIPIVLGGILLGPLYGGILGFLFGAITLWAGISASDFFTNVLFTSQPFATTLICLGKGTLAGVGAGYAYKVLKNKNKLAASFFAAASAPIINTGLFILGGLTLVNGTLAANLSTFGAEGATVTYFLVIGCAGLNFIAEFALNIIIAPAINTIVNAVTKRIK